MKKLKYLFLLIFLSLMFENSYSQTLGYNFDVLSVEALIENHKTSRSLLKQRALLEALEQELFLQELGEVNSYYNVNKELDKYTRSFDIIDLLFNTLKTASISISTINDIEKKISSFKELLSCYNERIVKRGKIEEKDTIIFSISSSLINDVKEKTKSLYTSFSDLALISTGVYACSTSDLIEILESINYNLEQAKSLVDKAYIAVWKYITLRSSSWQKDLKMKKTKNEVLSSSFSSWKSSQKSFLK